MELLPLTLAFMAMTGVPVKGQETRCICWLREQTTLYTYDMEKLNLGLPCIYRMTSIKTPDSRCHLTVDLSMTSQTGSSVRPAGLRYLVTSDGATTGGIIDGRGVHRVDPTQGISRPILMEAMSRMDGVDLMAYLDDTRSYRLSLVECRITLDFKPGQYLGVYSHNFSTDYNYNLNDLCGDCDGSSNERSQLPSEILNHMSSLRNRDAAMLYMTSKHISGGSRRCHDYKALIDSCPHSLALQALDTCGRLLDPKDSLASCLRMRTFMTHILDTYFDCVTSFCTRNSWQGCRYVKGLARSRFCRPPSYLTC